MELKKPNSYNYFSIFNLFNIGYLDIHIIQSVFPNLFQSCFRPNFDTEPALLPYGIILAWTNVKRTVMLLILLGLSQQFSVSVSFSVSQKAKESKLQMDRKFLKFSLILRQLSSEDSARENSSSTHICTMWLLGIFFFLFKYLYEATKVRSNKRFRVMLYQYTDDMQFFLLISVELK